MPYSGNRGHWRRIWSVFSHNRRHLNPTGGHKRPQATKIVGTADIDIEGTFEGASLIYLLFFPFLLSGLVFELRRIPLGLI